MPITMLPVWALSGMCSSPIGGNGQLCGTDRFLILAASRPITVKWQMSSTLYRPTGAPTITDMPLAITWRLSSL